jgi:phage anti-repressor protein
MINELKPSKVDFNALVTTNGDGMSLNFQTKMILELQNTFSENEQRWYIANFYIYLHYHPTNEYPINLENVYKILGFTTKGNAKRVLENNFTIGEDYKSSFILTDKREIGGSMIEEIIMNVDTFKNLCMLIKTEKGKEIRKYYVKLENIFNKLANDERLEYEKIIKEQQKTIEETKKQLEIKTKLKVKKWYDQDPGHVIYAYKSSDTTNLITIGKSKNIKGRESNYLTHNQSGEMFFIKKCYNCDLTEKVIHHILDKYREESDKEWFNISKNLAEYVINIVCNFLDNFINCSEKLPDLKINEFIESCILPINIGSKLDYTPKTVEIESNENKIDRFINEYCEINDNNTCLSYELLGAYRLWCRGLDNSSRSQFLAYIKTKFKNKRKHYVEYNSSSLLTFFGIKPKDLIIKQENKLKLPVYEDFILKECKYNYIYRIKKTDFINEFTKWYKKNFPDYIFSKDEIVNLDAYLNRNFLRERISCPGKKNVPGIWGIQLKSDNTAYVGSVEDKFIKSVIKINSHTKIILQNYPNIIKASNDLNLSVCTIRNGIKRNRVFIDKKNNENNYILIYNEK